MFIPLSPRHRLLPTAFLHTVQLTSKREGLLHLSQWLRVYGTEGYKWTDTDC